MGRPIVMLIVTHFSMKTPFFWNSIPLEILRIVTKSAKVVTWPFSAQLNFYTYMDCFFVLVVNVVVFCCMIIHMVVSVFFASVCMSVKGSTCLL